MDGLFGKYRVILAPMAGVTDIALRTLCLEQGADLAFTEMVSAKGLAYANEKTHHLLDLAPGEREVAVQLFGHEPDTMASQASQIEQDLGDALAYIDVNMGCPARKIVSKGDGSALMKTPELAARIVESVKKAVEVPVTVKFRKGWDNGSVHAVEFARLMEASGADAVAVHGRTRAQMYAGRADWDIIREVRRVVHIPVIANGDVFTPEDAAHILRYTGCELAMIGRGSFGNPWLFARGQAAIDGREIPELPPLSDRIELAENQIVRLSERLGEHRACMEARHQLPWYLHGIPHSAVYRQELVQVNTLEDIRRVCRGIKRDLK